MVQCCVRRLYVACLALLAFVGSHAVVAAGELSPKQGDTIEVTKGPAPVKDRREVLTTVEAGRRLKAIDVRGNWVKVRVRKDGKTITGWIHTSRVRAVTPPDREGKTPGSPGESSRDMPPLKLGIYRLTWKAYKVFLAPQEVLTDTGRDDEVEVCRRGSALYLKLADDRVPYAGRPTRITFKDGFIEFTGGYATDPLLRLRGKPKGGTVTGTMSGTLKGQTGKLPGHEPWTFTLKPLRLGARPAGRRQTDPSERSTETPAGPSPGRPGSRDHEQCAEQLLDLVPRTANLLKTVVDQETCRKALPEARRLGAALRALARRLSALPEPTPAETDRLQRKHQANVQAGISALRAQMQRLKNSAPGLWEKVERALGEVPFVLGTAPATQ